MFNQKIIFEELKSIENENKYEKLTNEMMTNIQGGFCIAMLDKEDPEVKNMLYSENNNELILNEEYIHISCWKSRFHIEIMVDKHDLSMIRLHLLRCFQQQSTKIMNKLNQTQPIDKNNDNNDDNKNNNKDDCDNDYFRMTSRIISEGTSTHSRKKYKKHHVHKGESKSSRF